MNYVYALLDQNGDPFYVGKSKDLKRRKREHLVEVKNGNTLPKYNKLRKLIRSGFDIQIGIIEANIPDNKIDERETHHIAEYRKQYKLYNLTDGGEGGIHTTPEIREKISAAHLGKKEKPETCRKISEGKKGVKFTAKHKANLSKARRKRKTTDETRRRMSMSSTGRINIKTYKLIDPDGKEHITERGLTDFCRNHDLSTQNMCKVLNGERPHHKGWRIERWTTSV